MTRLEARDVIRIQAEIPGDETYDHLINLNLDRELRKFTAMRKYPECYRINNPTFLFSNGIGGYFNAFEIPSTVQHLDVDNLFAFETYNDFDTLTHLISWDRRANNSTGFPRYFRRGFHGGIGVSGSNAIYIYPYDTASFNGSTQGFYYNAWLYPSWSSDIIECPILALEGTIIDKVTERLASLQKTGAAQKYAKLAMEQYIAARGVNTGEKTP